MKPLFLLSGAFAILCALAPAVWPASAYEPDTGLKTHTIRVVGLSNDGVMVQATAVPTQTQIPNLLPPLLCSSQPSCSPSTVIPIPSPLFRYEIEQWRSLVAGVFPDQVDRVLERIDCESDGDPNKTGAEGEMGLLQIHPRWHHDATYDPLGNLLAAYRISAGGTDWSQWTCYPW